MKNQIDLLDSAGKTIFKIITNWRGCAISFCDSTFVNIIAKREYDNDADIDNSEFHCSDYNAEDIIEAGIMTREEIDIAKINGEIKRKERINNNEKSLLKQLLKKHGIPNE